MTTPTPGPTPYNPITSTKQLIPDGVAGYAKAIGAAVAVAIAMVVKAFADGSITGAEWRDIAISAVSAGVTAYALPNAVKPTPPAPVEPADGPKI